ncbi:MAG: flagellar hook-basal body complex protein FliE [Clostridia bacterium]|nr:flagellar hook-basal body complex protein FliE [Clostridia bacterium]
MAINGIGGFNAISPAEYSVTKTKEKDENGVSFSDYLKDALNKVNDLQLESEQMTQDFAAGRTDNIHQVMIAAEKADVALQFTMQIRTKIMDAYNEIMRIPV